MVYLTYQPDFRINKVWYVSVLSVNLQAMVSFLLVQKQFQLKANGLKAEPDVLDGVLVEAELAKPMKFVTLYPRCEEGSDSVSRSG